MSTETYLPDYRVNDKEIYYTYNGYYNDVEIVSVVDFEDKENRQEQLKKLLERAIQVGKNQRTKEIGQLLGVRK